MKITHITAAAMVPAAITGAAISYGVAGHPATRNPAPAKAAHAPGTTPANDTSARAGGAPAGPAHPARAAAHRAAWVTVRRGQTLSGIAAAHHVTWQAIYATPPNMKQLHNPSLLTAGERLRIPSDPKLRAAQFKARYAAKLAQESTASTVHEATAQARPPHSAASDGVSTAGESAFERCVAWRESSDTPTDPDGLFGILPSTWQSLGYSGTAGQASVAMQDQAFAKLYAEDGTAPWAPYDGC